MFPLREITRDCGLVLQSKSKGRRQEQRGARKLASSPTTIRSPRTSALGSPLGAAQADGRCPSPSATSSRSLPSLHRRVHPAAPAAPTAGSAAQPSPGPVRGQPQSPYLRHRRASSDLLSARMPQRPPFVFIPGEAGPAPAPPPRAVRMAGSWAGASWRGGAKDQRRVGKEAAGRRGCGWAGLVLKGRG